MATGSSSMSSASSTATSQQPLQLPAQRSKITRMQIPRSSARPTRDRNATNNSRRAPRSAAVSRFPDSPA